METIVQTSSTQGPIFIILMFMGYAIAFSYLLIALTKKDIKYLRADSERSLQYYSERVERDLKRLRDENTDLRYQLIQLDRKG